MSDSSSPVTNISIKPEDLVRDVYRALLKREPDAGGLASFTAAVKNGLSIEDFLVAAVSSGEYRDRIRRSVDNGTFNAPDIPQIPDREFYDPLFSPWLGYGEFPRYHGLAQDKTAVRADSCHVLYQLAAQAISVEGEFWECGVYRGGTASMLAEFLFTNSTPPKPLRLFDTFTGMPETNAKIDLHKRGDFSDTSLESVKSAVLHDDFVVYHPGFIPDTFGALSDSKIAFAHIDVDIYQSVLDCCEFIFPRLSQGGFMIFDDYGLPSCPGARKAVDQYFASTNVCPLVLPTGQAVVFASQPAGASWNSRYWQPWAHGGQGRAG